MRQCYKYRGYRLSKGGSPRHPVYTVVDKDGKNMEGITFPSAFKDTVDRIIYKNKIDEDPHAAAWEFRNLLWDCGKQYRASRNRHILEKVWNRGQGSLELLAVYPLQGIILVNDTLWNQYDQSHLDALLEKLECKDEYEIKHVQYGYSEYYSHNFGLNLLH